MLLFSRVHKHKNKKHKKQEKQEKGLDVPTLEIAIKQEKGPDVPTLEIAIDDLDTEWKKYLSCVKMESSVCLYHVSRQMTESAAAVLSTDAERTDNTNSFLKKRPFGEMSQPLGERPPKAAELTISTKTKVLFLNRPVDIESVFWQLPVVDYWKPQTGVLKKTMKLVCMTKDNVAAIEAHMQEQPNFRQDIIRQIDIPETTRTVRKHPFRRMSAAAVTACKETGGVMIVPSRFKDERKVTVGVARKDLMACRG